MPPRPEQVPRPGGSRRRRTCRRAPLLEQGRKPPLQWPEVCTAQQRRAQTLRRWSRLRCMLPLPQQWHRLPWSRLWSRPLVRCHRIRCKWMGRLQQRLLVLRGRLPPSRLLLLLLLPVLACTLGRSVLMLRSGWCRMQSGSAGVRWRPALLTTDIAMATRACGSLLPCLSQVPSRQVLRTRTAWLRLVRQVWVLLGLSAGTACLAAESRRRMLPLSRPQSAQLRGRRRQQTLRQAEVVLARHRCLALGQLSPQTRCHRCGKKQLWACR